MTIFATTNNYWLKKHSHPASFHLVGNTPLFEVTDLSIFEKVSNDHDFRVFGKLEMFNFGGSVKDRPSLYMIEEAEKEGILTKGKTIIEPTSGNTGIGLAWIGRLKGYNVILVLPETISEERKTILRSFGANFILTPGEDGMDGAIQECRRLATEEPDKYVMLDQFSNSANWKSHYETTGPEIWRQLDKKVDYLFAGLGTTGTLIGTSRFIRSKNPNLKVIGIQPTEESQIPGLKNLSAAKEVPSIFSKEEVDTIISVTSQQAVEMTRLLAKELLLLVGPSSGAALAGIIEYISHSNEDVKGNIVTIFPDSGYKYLSQNVF